MEILLKWVLFALGGWFFWWAFSSDEKEVELDPNRQVKEIDQKLRSERLSSGRASWLNKNNIRQMSQNGKGQFYTELS